MMIRRCGGCSRGMTPQQEKIYDDAMRQAFQAYKEHGASEEAKSAAQRAKEILRQARGL